MIKGNYDIFTIPVTDTTIYVDNKMAIIYIAYQFLGICLPISMNYSIINNIERLGIKMYIRSIELSKICNFNFFPCVNSNICNV